MTCICQGLAEGVGSVSVTGNQSERGSDSTLHCCPGRVNAMEQNLKKVKVFIAPSCLTVSDSMDCSPPGSSAHGILQARILEWVAIPFSRGIFLTQGLNPGLLYCKHILYHLSHQGSSKSCFFSNLYQVTSFIFKGLGKVP